MNGKSGGGFIRYRIEKFLILLRDVADVCNLSSTHAVFGGLYRWFFNNLKFDNFTLDIDSSVITRYGDQQGSKKGYNKHKPGRKSQHPLLAFVADIEMVANF